MKTEFPTTYLAAAAHFMAENDIRYYLNGLLVEAFATEARLVATDGSAAAVARWVIQNDEPFEVLIPRATVLLAIKLKLEFLSLERDAAGVWRLAGIPFTPIDGRYPDYRRIFPTSCSGVANHYDPALIARVAKAGKSLKLKSHPILRQNGADAALAHFYNFDNFSAVIMPLRMFNEKQPDLGMPTWGAARNK